MLSGHGMLEDVGAQTLIKSKRLNKLNTEKRRKNRKMKILGHFGPFWGLEAREVPSNTPLNCSLNLFHPYQASINLQRPLRVECCHTCHIHTSRDSRGNESVP